MKSWTEFHIAIVYFAGLFIALTSSVLIVLYLRPFKFVINKLIEKFNTSWSGGFISTIIIAGLLGAMAVSFRDCEGKYDYLLKSENATISKGLEQVSNSFTYLALVLGLWLIIFLILSLVRNKSKMPSN
jgi:hypothetical protein